MRYEKEKLLIILIEFSDISSNWFTIILSLPPPIPMMKQETLTLMK